MFKINLISFMLLFFTVACGNGTDNQLDGKSYSLVSWDVNHPEKQDSDVFDFDKGIIDSKTCHQFGFKPAPYIAKLENGVISFYGTISSLSEGTIEIEGKVNGNQIEGTMIWKKNNQSDIKYDYKGNLKSN